MIFVTLGTQDKSFKRLLEAIEALIVKGIITDKVIVQAGVTKYVSKYMEIFDFINMDEFSTLIKQCHVLITHGGVGSILNGISEEKYVIAVPRLKKYDEHENDHQIEIISKFDKLGYIKGCLKVDELADAYLTLESFVPAKYQANNVPFCKLIQVLIEK